MPTTNIIPFIPSDPNYSFNTTLEGEQFYFDVRWNERDAAWYFDMADANGTIMIRGVKIVLGTYLGRQSAHAFFTTNVLAAIDTTLSNVDPGFDDLGTRVIIKHYTEEALINELAIL